MDASLQMQLGLRCRVTHSAARSCTREGAASGVVDNSTVVGREA